MSRRRPGTVFLVGAGPGDPGLLTLRAAELIRNAQVVAHDELVSREILAMASPSAALVPVGHRAGQAALYRIHPAVLEHARSGRDVVRLKGGDPLIFGRAGEEIEDLDDAGVPWELVPGITAAQAAAAALGVPLTHRAHASDVAFATGHDLDGHGSLSDWSHLARAGTLVLYMATQRLADNIDRVVRQGRAPETPAAWVSCAGQASHRVVETLGTLAEEIARRNLSGPAVIIVGTVLTRRRPVDETAK